MRFLVDNNLSFKIALLLNNTCHDAVHVRDYAPPTAPDDLIMELPGPRIVL